MGGRVYFVAVVLALAAGCGRKGFDAISPPGGGDGDGGGTGDGASSDGALPDGVPATACIQDLSVAHDHSCARLNTGATYCWGRGDNGSLGEGGTTDQLAPILNTAAAGAQHITIGGRHGCAYAGGAVTCWGANTQLQQGVPSPFTPILPITVGSRQSCASLAGGGVACWGCSDYDPASVDNCALTSPRFDNTLGTIAAMSGKHWHTCAIVEPDRSIWCWGENGQGALGNGSTTSTLSPVRAGTLTGATQVSAGRYHTCAVVGGRLYTWGDNADGVLANNTTTDETSPIEVLSSGVAQCSSGGLHACILTTAGTVRCVGGNDRGQLGDGTSNPSLTFVDTVGLPAGIVAVETGARHSCARTLDQVWCWGRDTHGQLGNGAVSGDQPTPMSVTLPCP